MVSYLYTEYLKRFCLSLKLSLPKHGMRAGNCLPDVSHERCCLTFTTKLEMQYMRLTDLPRQNTTKHYTLAYGYPITWIQFNG